MFNLLVTIVIVHVVLGSVINVSVGCLVVWSNSRTRTTIGGRDRRCKRHISSRYTSRLLRNRSRLLRNSVSHNRSRFISNRSWIFIRGITWITSCGLGAD